MRAATSLTTCPNRFAESGQPAERLRRQHLSQQLQLPPLQTAGDGTAGSSRDMCVLPRPPCAVAAMALMRVGVSLHAGHCYTRCWNPAHVARSRLTSSHRSRKKARHKASVQMAPQQCAQVRARQAGGSTQRRFASPPNHSRPHGPALVRGPPPPRGAARVHLLCCCFAFVECVWLAVCLVRVACVCVSFNVHFRSGLWGGSPGLDLVHSTFIQFRIWRLLKLIKYIKTPHR